MNIVGSCMYVYIWYMHPVLCIFNIYICIYRERMIPIASYSIFISVWWPCRIAVSLHILSQACQGMRLSDVQPTMAVSGLIIGILGHGLFLQCDMCYLLFSTTRYTIHIIYIYIFSACMPSPTGNQVLFNFSKGSLPSFSFHF